MNRRQRIAIVVPTYNEESNIESVLREIADLRASAPEWEILPIVVDDGSQDRTRAVLDRVAPFHGAMVIPLPLNLGIGKAVQTGFLWSLDWGADVTVQLDGDGQHPASEAFKIVRPVLAGEADVVIGSRYCLGAGGRVSGCLRLLGTWLFSWLLKLVVGIRIHDTTSGFRAFGREATEFLSRYYSDDYPEVEAYVTLSRATFTILESPVRMRPRRGGASSITPLRGLYYLVKVTLSTLIEMIRPRPLRRRGRSQGLERA